MASKRMRRDGNGGNKHQKKNDEGGVAEYEQSGDERCKGNLQKMQELATVSYSEKRITREGVVKTFPSAGGGDISQMVAKKGKEGLACSVETSAPTLSLTSAGGGDISKNVASHKKRKGWACSLLQPLNLRWELNAPVLSLTSAGGDDISKNVASHKKRKGWACSLLQPLNLRWEPNFTESHEETPAPLLNLTSAGWACSLLQPLNLRWEPNFTESHEELPAPVISLTSINHTQ